jgi:archaellum component FlaC
MSTKIAIKEASGKISTSRWVNDETPLNADNMNVLLDGVRDNLNSIDNINSSVRDLSITAGNLNTSVGNLDTSVGNLNNSVENLDTSVGDLNSKVSTLEAQSGKTKYSLNITYNELVNGVIKEQEASFNGSTNVKVDLTGIAGTGGGGDLPLSTSPDTGLVFINNTLKWQDGEDIEGLVLILDGGGIGTITLENGYAVESIQQDASTYSNNLWSISADANTGLEFRQGVLMWSEDPLIPDLLFIMDGGTSASILDYPEWLNSEDLYKYLDVDNNGVIVSDIEANDSDAVYLHYFTSFSNDYPLHYPADFDLSGAVDNDDSVLLTHFLLGEYFTNLKNTVNPGSDRIQLSALTEQQKAELNQEFKNFCLNNRKQ